MRTSLNDLKHNEDFLHGSLAPEDAVLVRAKLLIDPVFRMNMALQRKIYALIYGAGRQHVKSEVKAAERKIFQDPYKADYRRKIDQLFLNP
jgi:hypothetical protein